MTRFTASALVLLALAVPVLAQRDGARPPFVPPKDANYHLFRGLLHFHGVKPVTAPELREMGRDEFRDLIVIVLGCSTRGESDWAGGYTKPALANSGAVLIATDRGADLSFFLPPSRNGAELVITGEKVEPLAVMNCYGGDGRFPFLTAVRSDPAFDALFANRPRVATAIPSRFAARGVHDTVPLAVALTPGNAAQANGSLFAVGGVGRNGSRTLVMADPDVLSNQMLYSSGLPDRTGQGTDNWAFANDLVKDFLRGPDGRSRCLFVENGRIVDRFDEVELKSVQNMPPIPDLPLPNPLDRRVQAKLADVIDRGLVTLEDRHLPDTAITGPPNEPTGRRFNIAMMVIASAVGLSLVGLMARRLFLAGRHRKDLVPAPTDPLFLGDETALGSFGQRRAELLRGSDFRKPVAHRIRTLFAARGLPAGFGRHRLPPLEFRGRVDREQLGGDIRDLWDVAARDEADPLPYSEWKDLEPVLANVHAAAAADRWRFATTPPKGPA